MFLNKKSIRTLLLLLSLLSTSMLHAKVKLHSLFTSGMVLQRNAAVNIWGWADPSEKVTVRFLEKTYTTTAGKNGKWLIKFNTPKEGGPYTLQVNDVSLEDILLGDVWICSGQSNMAFMLKDATGGAEAIAVSANDKIRLYTVPRNISFNPQEDIADAESWQTCNPTTIPNFSAVAYYMAAELQKRLNIPIGLIHTSYGGTYIEDFISKGAMDTIKRLQPVYQSIAGKDEKSFLESKQQVLKSSFPRISFYTNNKSIWDTANIQLPEITADWKAMKLPVLWEKSGLDYMDGVVWFYKEINLSEQDLGKDAFLSLGRIADQSITYFNDQHVGSSPDSRDFLRQYAIPANLLKTGINKVLVRVTNKGRNGGIWGPASKLLFQTGTHKTSLAGDWHFYIEKAKLSFHPNDIPSSLYNAMTHPLVDFSCKGIVWYQGESNANWANEYEVLLKKLIRNWRAAWKQPALPFITIQLPNYDPPGSSESAPWAIIREAQWNTTAMSATGLVTTIDVGEAGDIHPRNKKPVGERMALQVLKVAYKQKILADGPVFDHMKQEGNKIRLYFKNYSGQLVNKNNRELLQEFTIAGADHQFITAQAKIENNTILVWSDKISHPEAARYAWANNPVYPGLYNEAGLPASPFRTDKWKTQLEDIAR
jgi:sialate O-acetylesterase